MSDFVFKTKILKSEKKGATFLKTERKKNNYQLKCLHPEKYLSKTKAKQTFLRCTESERVCHQQTTTIRNLKDVFRQKENDTIWKSGSTQRNIKSTRNGKYVGKHKRLFSHVLNLFKM